MEKNPTNNDMQAEKKNSFLSFIFFPPTEEHMYFEFYQINIQKHFLYFMYL